MQIHIRGCILSITFRKASSHFAQKKLQKIHLVEDETNAKWLDKSRPRQFR